MRCSAGAATTIAEAPERASACSAKNRAPSSNPMTPTPASANRLLSVASTMPPSHGPQPNARTTQSAPRRADSRAAMDSSTALAAAYAACPGLPARAAMEENSEMNRRSSEAVASSSASAPTTFVLNTLTNCSSSRSSRRLSASTPAPCTTPAIGPKV